MYFGKQLASGFYLVVFTLSLSEVDAGEIKSWNDKVFEKPYSITVEDKHAQPYITLVVVDRKALKRVMAWAKERPFPTDPPWLGKEARPQILTLIIERQKDDRNPIQVSFYRGGRDEVGPWNIKPDEIEKLLNAAVKEKGM